MSETSEEWLARNARELEFPVPKEVTEGPMLTARTHALESQAVKGSKGPGRWTVVMKTSDRNHEVVLGAYPDATHVGACDCEDFQHRDRAEGCKHLCFVRVKEAMGDLRVPDVSEFSPEHRAKLRQKEGQPEPDVIDAEVEEVKDTEDMPDPAGNGQQAPQRPDAFATPLPGGRTMSETDPAIVRVWTHERKYEPEWVTKHEGCVVLGFGDHKRTFPWSQIQEIQEMYEEPEP